MAERSEWFVDIKGLPNDLSSVVGWAPHRACRDPISDNRCAENTAKACVGEKNNTEPPGSASKPPLP